MLYFFFFFLPLSTYFALKATYNIFSIHYLLTGLETGQWPSGNYQSLGKKNGELTLEVPNFAVQNW